MKKTTKQQTTTATSERTKFAGKKIVVLNAKHEAAKGTKRQRGLDIILASRTTDEALPRLRKIGADPSFIAFAVERKLVQLASA